MRKKIVKHPEIKKGFVAENNGTSKKIAKLSWCKLLSKVYKIDMTICSKCKSGKIKYVSMIKDHEAIEKILTHLGLKARSPPISPPRYSQIGFYDD